MSNENVYEQVDRLFRCGAVVRWHRERGIPGQSIADHTWRCMQILNVLYEGDVVPPPLMRYVLSHDIGEGHTGDVPATLKWERPALRAWLEGAEWDWAERHEINHHPRYTAALMPLDMQAVAKFVDYAEAIIYCLDLLRTGNREGQWPFCRLLKKMEEYMSSWGLMDPQPIWWSNAEDMLEFIQLEWESLGGRWLDEKELEHHD